MNRRQFLKAAIVGSAAATLPIRPRTYDRTISEPEITVNGQAVRWPDGTYWADGHPPVLELNGQTVIHIVGIDGKFYARTVSL